jgi:hypothetical protein
MIKLSLKDTGAALGTIEDADLKLLIDQLEEEDRGDTDYYISSDTIDILKDSGASANLLEILRDAVGTSEGVDIVWKKA